jgi:hypothetical protein
VTATVFFRLLKEDDKEARLLDSVQELRAGATVPGVHRVDQETFRMIPGAPFAYWVRDAMRRKFKEFPKLEGNTGTARVGLQTSDDFRFLRGAWEVPSRLIGQTREDTAAGKSWVAFAKGGEYAPFYSDIHLLVSWSGDGLEMKAWADPLYGNSGWSRIIKSTEFYFRPGLTWPCRTTSGISFRILPSGCIFSPKGPALFAETTEGLAFLLGVCTSRPFEGFTTLFLGAADVAARSYEVGIIQRVPIPKVEPEVAARLGILARSIHNAKRSLDTVTESSHAFILPALLQRAGPLLAGRLADWNRGIAVAADQIVAAQREIDEICYGLYGLSAEDRAAIEAELGTEVRGLPAPLTSSQAAADLLSWMIGVVLGRFDVRLATGERSLPALPEPFAPLPPRSPGMLPDGRVPAGYPIAVADDGILVDDEGHAEDVVARLREVLHLLWPDASDADAIEKEVCALLAIRSLREYLSRTGKGGFWDDHFRRYSKSRRRAPIVWLIQSPAGRFRIWLYAHRLTRDTLPNLLGVRYLGGKSSQVRQAIAELRPAGEKSAELTKKEERRLAELDELLLDLEEFASKVRAVMARASDRGEIAGYAPVLNDGVVLAAAPLHELIPWPKTRKHEGRTVSELRACWEELAEGQYDWAQAAMLYWPARVTEKSRADRSLALAHGLDAEFFPGLRAELRRQAEPATGGETGADDSLDADEEDDD